MDATEQKILEVQEFILAKKIEKIRKKEQMRTRRLAFQWIFIGLAIVGGLLLFMFLPKNGSNLSYLWFLPFIFFVFSERDIFIQINNLESRIDALEEELRKREEV